MTTSVSLQMPVMLQNGATTLHSSPSCIEVEIVFRLPYQKKAGENSLTILVRLLPRALCLAVFLCLSALLEGCWRLKEVSPVHTILQFSWAVLLAPRENTSPFLSAKEGLL